MRKLFVGLSCFLFACFLLTGNTQVEATTGEFTEDAATSINELNSFTNVVVFIRFADETDYVAPYDLAYYINMFNGVDMLSLRDYYLEVSYNQLTIDSVVVSDVDTFLYYTDEHNRNYYQPYDLGNPYGYEDDDEAELREHTLLKNATDWVEENNFIDESINLDMNDDGDIDSVTFLVSGEDEGWYSLLWPHKWSLNSYYDYSAGDYKTDAPTINGKYLWDYTFELLGNSTEYENKVDVAVLAHETFHLISAPDLYHYFDYDWITAIGKWGLMDQIDLIPSHMLGYMKYQYGNWITEVEEITSSGTYTLYPLQEDGSNLYRIPLGYSNEYIYLEYRDNEGLYESTLPGTGLILYRVDEDFIDEGNEDGYYNNGITNEEVWLFRPNMDDILDPILFDQINPEYDVDGDPDLAAILSTNSYKEAGYETDILLFDSDGNVLDYVINNVIEHDGYITFDFYISGEVPKIKINDTDLDIQEEVVFVNEIGTYYYLNIENYEDEGYRYTLDGSTPTLDSPIFTNGEIEITIENNIFTLANLIVKGNGDALSTIIYSKEFTFVDTVETVHDGYGNLINTNWVLNYEDMTHFTFEFNEDSYTENSDIITVYLPNGEEVEHSGYGVKNKFYEIYGTSFVINFETDETVDNLYGFEGTLTTLASFDSTAYYIEEEIVYHQIASEFVNPVQFVTFNNDIYHADMVTDLDTDVIGVYTVTYEIYNANFDYIDSLTQTVHVGDFIAPVITLLEGNIFVEAGTNYTDPGYSVYDYSDELDEMIITGSVDVNVLGTYEITYQIADLAGNVSEIVTRTVTVKDTIKPEVSLNPGIDTINIGEDWIDTSVTATDTFDQTLIISESNNIDNQTVGKYTVYYAVEDDSGNITGIYRMVNVVEAPIHNKLELECEQLVTTFEQGIEFTLPICTYDEVQIIATNPETVLYNTTGTYELRYIITIDEHEYILRKFVFVVPTFNNIEVLNYVEDKRRDTL